ncbi:MAG: tetratricopeptide repeat protein [Syntrophaceae bacterium]|nr:tetratricopeptide repeat protein [Syntrophaceae bacterium]
MSNSLKKNHSKQKIVIYIVLALLTFAVYWQVDQFGFTTLDDDIYVTENGHVQSGISSDGVHWAFSTTYAEFWHPLTWLSLMFNYQLHGLNAGGYHLTNIVLHILSTLLLFSLFHRMTGAVWKSIFIATFFALHPLRVESVAWIAERKDALSMFFGLAAIYAYVRYAESCRFFRYFICFILFAFALMSKPTMVTLPFVLMLLDYWPLQRWQKAMNEQGKTLKSAASLVWEKIPLIFLTIVFSILTFWAHNKGGMIASLEHLPFLVRVQNMVVSYVSYLGKIFYPVDLAFFYPYPYAFPLWKILTSCFILAVITSTVIYTFKKYPFLFVGWFWYLGTLVPVIGLVKSANYAMADRCTYLPSIGIAMIVAWGIPLLFPRVEIRKKILFPAATAFLAILSVLTWHQCGYWKNSVVLCRHALQVTKNNYMVHNFLGLNYQERGQNQRAILDFNKAIYFKPNYADAYSNRGNAYSGLGQYQQAMDDFNKALRLNPNSAKAYYNRGAFAFNKLGEYQRAIEDFNEAIRLKPDLLSAYEGQGAAYSKIGQYQRAINYLNQAIHLKPNKAFAYGLRGAAYLKQGNKEQSCRDVRKACTLGDCKWLEWAQGYGYCL